MPIYTLRCDKCGYVERYCNHEDIPKQKCETCSSQLVRDGLDTPTVGKPSFQTKVTLGSGEKIAGNFKESRKGKGWFRP